MRTGRTTVGRRVPFGAACPALSVLVLVLTLGCSTADEAASRSPSTSRATSTTTSTSAAAPAPERRVIALPADLSGVEGIAIDPVTRSLFVGEWGRGRIVRGPLPDDDGSDIEPTIEFATFSPTGADGRSDVVGLAVDAERRRLIAAGGTDPHVYVYDIDDDQLIAKVALDVAPGSIINDVGVGPDGAVFATVSAVTPAVFEVLIDEQPPRSERFVDYGTGTPIPAEPSNLLLNGIVVEVDAMLTVHTRTGQMFRIDRTTKDVVEVDTGGQPVGRDGLALVGDTLYCVDIKMFSGLDRERITVTELSSDRKSGRVVGEILDDEFSSPTTLALLGNRLLTVNAKFGLPESARPFTVFDFERR